MIQGLKLDSFNLDLLEKFNLRRHIDNSVGTLSFGQQKIIFDKSLKFC